jgi:hypothetical protein
MRPMSTIRRWHFEQLRCSLNAVRYIVQTTAAQDLVTYRDHDDGWTAAEVIGHLLDCERLFVERARLTMTCDRPALPFPDQDQEVIQGRYNERDPQTILTDWCQVRDEYLACMPGPGDSTRVPTAPTGPCAFSAAETGRPTRAVRSAARLCSCSTVLGQGQNGGVRS